MTLPSDELLLAAFANGDREAFDRLTSRYSAELDSFFRRRLPDDGRVEPKQVQAILAHTAACAACRREHRRADRALTRLEPSASLFEKLVRWGVAAVVLALLVGGLRSPSLRAPAAPPARYRVVGNASGVVAYTPEGIIVGAKSARPLDKEVSR